MKHLKKLKIKKNKIKNNCIFGVILILVIFLLLNWDDYIIFIVWPILGLNFSISMLATTDYIKYNNKNIYDKILSGDIFFIYFLSKDIKKTPDDLLYNKVKYLRMCFYSMLLPFIFYIISLIIR